MTATPRDDYRWSDRALNGSLVLITPWLIVAISLLTMTAWPV